VDVTTTELDAPTFATLARATTPEAAELFKALRVAERRWIKAQDRLAEAETEHTNAKAAMDAYLNPAKE
jgi:hypothetical protein